MYYNLYTRKGMIKAIITRQVYIRFTSRKEEGKRKERKIWENVNKIVERKWWNLEEMLRYKLKYNYLCI